MQLACVLREVKVEIMLFCFEETLEIFNVAYWVFAETSNLVRHNQATSEDLCE